MKKLVIGHRGALAYEIGNTLESFQRAIEMGADMIEFDVRKTKDGIMIIHHYGNIGEYLIKDLNYEELEEKRGYKIPTLEETLAFISGKAKVDVETKEVGYENEVVDLVLKYFKKDDFIITSFNDESVKKAKETYPDLQVGLLLGAEKPKNIVKTRLSEVFFKKRFLESKADILLPHRRLLYVGALKRAKKIGKPVIVWPVDDGNKISRLMEEDTIEGIITNKPDVAVKARGENQ